MPDRETETIEEKEKGGRNWEKNSIYKKKIKALFSVLYKDRKVWNGFKNMNII